MPTTVHLEYHPFPWIMLLNHHYMCSFIMQEILCVVDLRTMTTGRCYSCSCSCSCNERSSACDDGFCRGGISAQFVVRMASSSSCHDIVDCCLWMWIKWLVVGGSLGGERGSHAGSLSVLLASFKIDDSSTSTYYYYYGTGYL